MTWVLNDTVVPQTAYEDCQRIKRTSGKCHLMLLENGQIQNPSICRNCGGIGEIIIEVITGGPQMSPMRVEPNSGETTTCIDEQWYKRKLSCYPCVVCNETGRRPHDYEVREMQL
jgi:hypothetical protein